MVTLTSTARILALLSLVVALPSLAEECAPPARDYSGILSFYIENDSFLNSDDSYTSGVGINWSTGDAESYGPKSLIRGLVRSFSFLPAIGDESYRNFASFTLGQEIYTPTDIEAPVPPPDQQPYAGVLFLDTTVFGVGERSMHRFKLRLGCVGPCSGAEQVQRRLHEWIGSPIPQGWDYQLENELLINVDYGWNRRIRRRTEPGKANYDVSFRSSGGVGNYYIGADAGVMGRLGHNLPDNYAAGGLRTGGAAGFVGLVQPAGPRWRFYLFVGLQTFAIARFLPIDGNTFTDGPHVQRDDLFAYLTSGFVVEHGRVSLSWTLNNVAGLNEFEASRSNDFGTLSFSYSFR